MASAYPLRSPSVRRPDDHTAPSHDGRPRSLLDLDIDYTSYSHPPTPPAEDDENASLRSQALNADGTPKRPMNAFMIFARRRRPQVSAANQMMRTGEISKILSKEWNTMPMCDKQFYLDQAKKLKENFNAKYPDYVYRRRPNNSRKKRRMDAAPYDAMISPHDYDPSPDEYDSASPVDHHQHALAPNVDNLNLASHSYRFPSHATAAAAAYPQTHAATAANAYPTDSNSYPYYPRHHAAAALGHYDTSAQPSLSLSTATFGPHTTHAHAGGPNIYHPEDDAAEHGGGGLWPSTTTASSAAAYPPVKLEPLALPQPAWHSNAVNAAAAAAAAAGQHDGDGGAPNNTLRLSARRGVGSLHPAPLPLLAAAHGHGHARNWSDSTTTTTTTGGTSSASPPSSAGSTSGFPAALGGGGGCGGAGAGSGGGNASFQTLTAPFYAGGGSSAHGHHGSSGTVSPSTASVSSASPSPYFSGVQGHSQSTQQQQQQQHRHVREREVGYDSHSHSPPYHLAQPRVYGSSSTSASSAPHQHQHHHPHTGPTLGSTLALSPANVQHGSLWSSVRTKAEL